MISQASAIVGAVRISSVWRGLGGDELLRGRGRAFWRKGDGLNVSVRDSKNVWFDHVANEGGGVLDLIVLVKGVTRKDALFWLSNFVGIPMVDEPLAQEDLARLVARERAVARELPTAMLWRRTALVLADEILEGLKENLFDGGESVNSGEITFWTLTIARWKRAEGEDLINEFTQWREMNDAMTGAMVQAAALHETADRRAIHKLVVHRGLSVVQVGTQA